MVTEAPVYEPVDTQTIDNSINSSDFTIPPEKRFPKASDYSKARDFSNSITGHEDIKALIEVTHHFYIDQFKYHGEKRGLSWTDAEEAAYDALYNISRKFDDPKIGYNPNRAPYEVWIWKIANNTITDRDRKNKRKKDPPTYSIEQNMATFTKEYAGKTNVSGESPIDNDPQHIMKNNYQSPELTNAIDSLTDEHKEIIELAYFQEWFQGEISEELNIPLGTTKSRRRLALKHLEKSWKNTDLNIPISSDTNFNY